MRRSPHSWEHVEGFRLDFGSWPTHPLLLTDPVVPLSIHRVLSLGLPMWISQHCRGRRSGQTGVEAAQHLLQGQGRGLGYRQELCLGLVLVLVEGPLLLMGRGDGAGAPGALLDRSAPLTGVGFIAAFSGRGRAGTLEGGRCGGTLVLGQEKGLIRDAVARRGSWRGVGRRCVDALEARAEV